MRRSVSVEILKFYRKAVIFGILLLSMAGVAGCAKIQENDGSVKNSEGEVADSKKPDSFQIDENEKVYKETMEHFITFLDKKDAKGIKSLLAEGVLSQDEDIDSQIDRLFAYYDENSIKNTIDYALDGGFPGK